MEKKVNSQKNKKQKSLNEYYNTGKHTKSYTPSGSETSDGIKLPHTTSNVSTIKEK